MTEFKSKLILVLDFDGVLHSYKSGWQGATVISDPPVEGAQQFCELASQSFSLWIVSSRNSLPGGREAIVNWLRHWNFPADITIAPAGIKPPAFVILDDRAITFTGEWPSITELISFQPWNKK